MRSWWWAAVLPALASCAPSSDPVRVESLGQEGYRLTVTATGTTDPADATQLLIPTAQRLCAPKLAKPGRYTFDAKRAADAAPADPSSSVTLRQEITCTATVEVAAAAPEPRAARNDQAVRAVTDRYFGAIASGDFQAAYELTTPQLHGGLSAAEWAAQRRGAHGGAPKNHRIARVTWYDDPPGAEPGVYAAVDYTADLAGHGFECGYVVWRGMAGGAFRLVREERNVADAQIVAKASPEQVAAMRSTYRCPD